MRTKEQDEAIRQELAMIAKKGKGILRPDAVVKAAKSKDSALHSCFPWDDRKAAHERRIDLARALIRSIWVDIKTETTEIRTVAYVRDPDLESDEQGYVSTVSLVGEEERSRRAIVEEFMRAAAALRRARTIALALRMEDEIDAVTDQIDTLRTKIQARIEEKHPPH